MKRAATASRFLFAVTKMNELEGDYDIPERIMEEIDKAHIVLADFTLNPANVYFELGYARGKGKRVIQAARKNTVLEFDIRNQRTIFFQECDGA